MVRCWRGECAVRRDEEALAIPFHLLVLGYGNPGRCDDGLGPALVARLEDHPRLSQATLESNYQLVVEDAAEVARHDVVVFVDASVNGPEPFEWREVRPGTMVGPGTHVLPPEAVLTIAREVFGARPRAYVLAIRGYRFEDFGEGLSERAQANLDAAVEFLDSWVAEALVAARSPAEPSIEETR